MKIEKINENQIRCTLTRADLAERHLHLGELAYGTEKAKSLFQDMMQQAACELGFDTEDLPLMIEAIPSSSDSIVLIITKVEDPEELDARFSRFAPAPVQDADTNINDTADKLEGADDILDFLAKIREQINEEQTDEEAGKNTSCRLFSFATMDNVLNAADMLDEMYFGPSTLYKDTAADLYILALSQSDHSTQDFNRICNMLTEYGTPEKVSGSSLAFLEEHCETLIPQTAVETLCAL